jgi:sugar (pentulose or hexulose) kinase
MAAAATSAARSAVTRVAREMASSELLFLGLDSSTQGLKATLINGSTTPVMTAAINYSRDLPH